MIIITITIIKIPLSLNFYTRFFRATRMQRLCVALSVCLSHVGIYTINLLTMGGAYNVQLSQLASTGPGLCAFKLKTVGDGREEANVSAVSCSGRSVVLKNNVMVALPNIGGALCSTPQSLADAHY